MAALLTGTQVMVIFRGAEAYISPNWYPSKHEAHVGIEIAVTSLVGEAKLSQNRGERDGLNAADTLNARGREELARLMRNASATS